MIEQRPIQRDPLFWLTMLAGGLVLALTLWNGIGVDSAIISYCSWVWKHYGLPPYVGCKEADYPGIFILHRLALLFGENALGFRIFDFLVQLNCLVLIYWLTRKLSGQSLAGVLAGLFYAAYYFGLDFSMQGEREGFVFWLMLIATALSLQLKRSPALRNWLVGSLAGFIFLIKPTFGLLWPLFGAWLILDNAGSSGPALRKALGNFLFGCFWPGFAVVLYYFASGHLRELYEVPVYFMFKVYTRFPVYVATGAAPYSSFVKLNYLTMGPYLLKLMVREYPLVLGGAVLLWLQMGAGKLKPARNIFWLLVSLLVVSLVSAYLQKGIWNYHRIPFWGLMTIFAGAGWAGILERVRGDKQVLVRELARTLAAMALVGWMLWSAGPALWSFAWHYSFRSVKNAHRHQYPIMENAAELVQSLVPPDQEIAYFGQTSMLPFLMLRKLVSPFPFTIHLYETFEDGTMSPLQHRWRRKYNSSFKKKKPRVFVFDTTCLFCSDPDLKPIFRAYCPEIAQALERDYSLVEKIGMIEIYLRQEGQDQPTP